jgi:hypothetical protein
MQIAVKTGAAKGKHVITVTASGGGLTETATVTVNVTN